MSELCQSCQMPLAENGGCYYPECDNPKPPNLESVNVEVCRAQAGPCLIINDRRVAGLKPHATMGEVLHKWTVKTSEILRAVDAESQLQTLKELCGRRLPRLIIYAQSIRENCELNKLPATSGAAFTLAKELAELLDEIQKTCGLSELLKQGETK